MGAILQQRLKTSKFTSTAQEASLALVVATGALREATQAACARHGITEQQYNLLRILRGAHPEGYARCDVLDRMIDRASDVTRITDRLEQQGYVRRGRSGEDRRLSLSYITGAGLALLERVDPEIDALHRHLDRTLTRDEQRQLTALCEKIIGHVATHSNTEARERADSK